MLDMVDLDLPLAQQRFVSWVLALAVAVVAYLVLVLVRRGEPPNDSELGMPADQAPLDPGIAATIKSTPMEVPPKGCRGR